ncbi:hypothetical protein [Vibrio mediterranei]|uniref:hypothetical protein n=1 Tax=Vibrio mediterranei TaxID=689 RepID=UPI00148D4CF6|nr:hypothetical protein [Vibrio mediterranei]NOI26673.1 hypothetical protein [Vibrio mediterranei]
MNIRSLFFKIQAISEQASIESGTSYDEYIRLFSLYFERSFKRRSKEALKIARQFGYDSALADQCLQHRGRRQ